MQNKILKTAFIALGAMAFASLPAHAQDDQYAKVKIKTTDLGGGVYMMMGAGGNLGLSTGTDGAFLIDDQFAPLSKKIMAAIDDVSDSPVRFLINTHWHFDHSGGNENFGKAGAIIVAHDNVRMRMSTDQVMKDFGREVKAAPKVAQPIISFAEEISFHQNEQTIHVFHVKDAHTDGDAFVYFEEADVLHMGDVFFNKMYPYIDLGSGGSINGMIAAQERALALVTENTKIIPGHGPLGNKDDLQNNLAMLKAVRMAVLEQIAKGKTADETVEADVLADLNEEWGGGFMKPEAVIRAAYKSLSGG